MEPQSIYLKRARKRVEALKGFYSHLSVYLIVNIVLFVIRRRVLEFFAHTFEETNFLDWIDWNILAVPFFWGIGLLYHAAKVFQYKFKFVKNWEEKQLRKFMR
ncbi:MAG: 2TM domain-containing protein [Aequorivita sp.]